MHPAQLSSLFRQTKMNNVHRSGRYSLLVFVSSFLFARFVCSVEMQETFPKEILYLNVTDCSDEMQVAASTLKEVLEVASCSRRLDIEPAWTEDFDANATADMESVVLSDVVTLLINNSMVRELIDEPFCRLPNLTYLYLRNNKFEYGDWLGFGSNCRPQSCGQEISVLGLEGNRLRSIRKNSFLCHMTSIITLYLNNNSLEQIEVGAFANSSQLSHMYLSRNSLVRLERGTFFNLSYLWILDLSFNKLKEVECFREPDLLRLGNLDLNDNELEHLPHGVFEGLRNLLYMTLANNRIATVGDGAFHGLSRLNSLDMYENNLTVLSEKSFVGLEKLRSLDLSYNQIHRIEIQSGDLFPNLTSLVLRGNRLNVLPQLMGIERLESLELQDNVIEAIGSAVFYRLVHLKTLDLSFNRIQTLDDECFSYLDSLTHLSLSHNRLNYTEHLVTGYDSMFSESATATFQHLIDLDLSHNRLTEFSFHIPEYFDKYSLKYLNVSHNNITRISINSVVSPILELIVMDMSHNSIAELSMNHVFLTGMADRLEDLYCNDNDIQDVESDFFQRMFKLRQVNLANNKLATLYLDLPVRQKRERIVLALSGNNWSCDCHLEWVRDMVTSPSSVFLVEDYDKMICSRQFRRFRDVSVHVRDALRDTDFLCQFPSDEEHHCVGSSRCRLPCPDSCACYRSSDSHTIIVDCHNRNLTTVPLAIPEMTQTWYLDANDIDRLQTLPHLPKLRTLAVNRTGLVLVDSNAFNGVTSLQNLFMQNNRLTFLPNALFGNLTNLRLLNLAYNQLSSPSVTLFTPLIALNRLYLNDNRLRYFPIWALDELTGLSGIGISDNPWSCDCYFVLQLTSWMSNASRKLLDSDLIYCWESAGNYSIYLNNFDETLCLNATLSGLTRQQTVVLFSILSVTVAIVVLLVLVFIFRYEMQVLIYARYGVRLFSRVDDEEDAGKLYDAFVSYSSFDEAFVVNDLLPGLEAIRQPYKVCLHHRDFLIGAFINENIFQAIEDSRRTIIVLSENFVRSEWCRFEFRTAHAQMLQDRQNRVVVVMLGDVPADDDLGPEMKLYLRTNTYLAWGDKLFWKKLYFVLPKKAPPEKEVFQAEGFAIQEDVL